MSKTSTPADRLEDAWQHPTVVPEWPIVFGHDGTNDGWSQFDEATRLELAEIDLEWRWRCNLRPAATRHGWKHYTEQLRLTREASIQLAKRELLVRTCWGDRPSFIEVAQGFDEPRPVLKQMGDLFTVRFPIHAEMTMNGAKVLKTPLPYFSNWGRQTSKEPPAPAVLEESNDCVRIVFANREEKRISRRQFSITRHGLSVVLISAADASVTARCNGVELPPGQSIHSALPVTLANQHWSLRLEAE